tara:strand:- start:347 stop:772 length:426 start_codon:yes stop_codon:yes gene_type:complete
MAYSIYDIKFYKVDDEDEEVRDKNENVKLFEPKGRWKELEYLCEDREDDDFMEITANGVQLLTIGSEDIITNLDDEDHNLSEEQKERILKLDDDVMYQAIYGATKHMELSDYYHMAIEDAIFYLKNYVTSNEEKDIDQTKK